MPKKRRWKIWRHAGFRIHYLAELDGDGRQFADAYVRFFRDKYPSAEFTTAYEWCSGPAFIAFTLLGEGLCERLCLSDINPLAVEAIQRTIDDNDLQDRVTVYLSDNLKSIPESENFDLVVGNPPWLYSDNKSYKILGSTLYAKVFTSLLVGPIWRLLAIDDGWHIHRDFYASISPHLNDGALVCTYVQAPSDTELWITPKWCHKTFIERKPYNVRPRPPIEDFQEMAAKADLEYIDIHDHRKYLNRSSFFRFLPGQMTDLNIMVTRKTDARRS